MAIKSVWGPVWGYRLLLIFVVHVSGSTNTSSSKFGQGKQFLPHNTSSAREHMLKRREPQNPVEIDKEKGTRQHRHVSDEQLQAMIHPPTVKKICEREKFSESQCKEFYKHGKKLTMERVKENPFSFADIPEEYKEDVDIALLSMRSKSSTYATLIGLFLKIDRLKMLTTLRTIRKTLS